MAGRRGKPVRSPQWLFRQKTRSLQLSLSLPHPYLHQIYNPYTLKCTSGSLQLPKPSPQFYFYKSELKSCMWNSKHNMRPLCRQTLSKNLSVQKFWSVEKWPTTLWILSFLHSLEQRVNVLANTVYTNSTSAKMVRISNTQKLHLRSRLYQSLHQEMRTPRTFAEMHTWHTFRWRLPDAMAKRNNSVYVTSSQNSVVHDDRIGCP